MAAAAEEQVQAFALDLLDPDRPGHAGALDHWPIMWGAARADLRALHAVAPRARTELAFDVEHVHRVLVRLMFEYHRWLLRLAGIEVGPDARPVAFTLGHMRRLADVIEERVPRTDGAAVIVRLLRMMLAGHDRATVVVIEALIAYTASDMRDDVLARCREAWRANRAHDRRARLILPPGVVWPAER